MIVPNLRLLLLDNRLAVCKLGQTADIPSWATGGDFSSITRTHDEISVVCTRRRSPQM